MAKVRITPGFVGFYEVEVKQAWYLPWQTVYDGCLPWRGTLSQATKLKQKLIIKYS